MKVKSGSPAVKNISKLENTSSFTAQAAVLKISVFFPSEFPAQIFYLLSAIDGESSDSLETFSLSRTSSLIVKNASDTAFKN